MDSRKKFCAKNRRRLILALNEGLIFLSSAAETKRNSDVNHPFRQDSDFLYLSGIEEPNSHLLIDPKTKKSYLFIPNFNLLHQIWEGRQLTTKKAKQKYGFDFVLYHSDFKKTFAKLAKRYRQIHALRHCFSSLKKYKIRKRFTHEKLRHALNELRVRKSKEEIALIKKANEISKKGHLAAMRNSRSGLYEYEIQAFLEKPFLANGAKHRAYPSIVAAGRNAAVLHYHSNDAQCRSADLVLIDAGCEIKGYASDITRTFPVNGKFSKKQRDIYQVVLNTQKKCIRMVRPKISMIDLHLIACRSILQGLIDLKIFKTKDVELILKKQWHRIFFPHGIGHMLGLDVHDVGGKDLKLKQKPKYLRSTRTLEKGMVITVEPGIYFIEAHFKNKKLIRKTRHVIDWKKARDYFSVGGIRIEDDILVTSHGHKNLTSVSKEIKEIERGMR